MSKRSVFFLAMIAAVAGSTERTAATTSAYMLNVTASVTSTCTLTASPVAFPALSSASTTTAISSVTVTCTPGNALTVALDGGTNATSGQRRLANGTNYVLYNLYQPTAAGNAESNPPVAWGNGGLTAAGPAFTSTCNGAAQVFNVYGHVAAGQTLYAGNYADAVTVTVTY